MRKMNKFMLFVADLFKCSMSEQEGRGEGSGSGFGSRTGRSVGKVSVPQRGAFKHCLCLLKCMTSIRNFSDKSPKN